MLSNGGLKGGICASRDEKLVYARINANSQEKEFAERSGGEKEEVLRGSLKTKRIIIRVLVF